MKKNLRFFGLLQHKYHLILKVLTNFLKTTQIKCLKIEECRLNYPHQ
jgi:hypothetical protein